MSTPDDAPTSRVTDKGQTTIPKPLREKYGIEPGDEIVWLDTEEGLVLEKRTNTSGRGMLVDDDLDDETREAVVDAFEEEIRESRETEWAVETDS